MKINWKKIPSCTTGGKPFFYHGENGAAIVWNRGVKAYAVEYGGSLLAYVPTVRRAKQIIAAKAFPLADFCTPNAIVAGCSVHDKRA